MQRFGMNQLHLVATILFSLILGTNAFSYKEAEHWGKKNSKCTGKHQSPIFLQTPGATGFGHINQTLRLTDFDKSPKKLTVKNTGHTVEIKADWSGKPPKITGGPLNGTYVFEKDTFHWNRTKNGTPNLLFEHLEGNLHNVESINSSAVIPPFAIASIFDYESVQFLFYEGSLDYPPCSESVTWFISDNGYPITYNLLNGFRKIKLAEGDMSNVRPFQALNKREVKWVYGTSVQH